MATLDAFGFSTRRSGNKNNLPSRVVNVNPSVAFIHPVDTTAMKKHILSSPTSGQQTRKPIRKSNNNKKCLSLNNKNTITRYFATIMDVEMEQVDECCIIRKKLPIMNIWNEIEHEYIQETLFEDEEEEAYKMKRERYKRHCETEQEEQVIGYLKRQKTIDTDLSNVMNQFLNLKSRIQLPSLPVRLMNEFSSLMEESTSVTEDLSRILKCKMTMEESNVYIYQISQEFIHTHTRT